MAQTIKDTLEQTGNRITEKATEFKNTVSEKVEEAADWAKEKVHQAGNTLGEMTQKAENKYQETFGSDSTSEGSCCSADIEEHMTVVASCGKPLGRVDHVEGNTIKLTRNDSPDGKHHLIPMSWVDHVDSEVHLDRNMREAQAGWQTV